MKKQLIFLGIETSCDETAASIVRENSIGNGEILSNIVSSQIEEHKDFGGVVPEIAARAHIEKIDTIINKALTKSKTSINDIDGIAVTAGPGLIVCLTVGLSTAKAIAASLNKPLIAVNHLEGHALSPKILKKINFPYLLLLISGGHTEFLVVKGVNSYNRLGTTIDDAVGECFDKAAKLLGIEFPGGPKIEEFAKKGDKNYFNLPKPIIHRGGCNLSFAGLKTAVLKISKKIKNEEEKYHLAASFQKTIEDILCKKSKFAMNLFKENYNNNKNIFVIAGGVASNNKIREKLINLSIQNDFEPIFPPKNLCSDNAAMIAWAGIERFKLGLLNELDFPAKARWPLDEKAPFLKGTGIKF
jgi:N6-L-threonylcarbamoyladenine synthase